MMVSYLESDLTESDGELPRPGCDRELGLMVSY